MEQALRHGVEEVCVVVWPGDEDRYAQAAGKHAGRIRFIAAARSRSAMPTPSGAPAISWPAIPSCTWSAITSV